MNYVVMPYSHQDDEIGSIFSVDEPDSNGRHHAFVAESNLSSFETAVCEDWLIAKSQLIEHEFIRRIRFQYTELFRITDQFQEFVEQNQDYRNSIHPGTSAYVNMFLSVLQHSIGSGITQLERNYE